MVLSSSHQIHLFWWLLLGLTASLATVSGQTSTINRIAESREPETVDYTGQIRQFSEIGRGGAHDGPNPILPRPWVGYVNGSASSIQWQWPNGTVVPARPSEFTEAVGDELYQLAVDDFGVILIRGPDYNSPDGEYCCVITTVSSQRRCVTLTTCPMLPFPANGRITYDPDTNVATHSCDPGYAPSPTGQRTCQSNNQWSGTTVTCERIMCPPLSNPVNGQVTVNTHTVGSVATYTCNNGYNLTGASMRMCEEDSGVIGQWTLQPPTCPPVDCGPLKNPTNGQVIVPATTLNNMATYSCNSGYTLNGTQTRTCQASGVWSNAGPTCEVLCPRETLSSGLVTYSPDSDPVLPEAVATYSCDTGYDMTGNRMRVCEEGTGWTGSLPVCTIVNCGALTRPPNGQVNTSSGTTYNQVATYSCDTGYNLVGPSTRTCQASGMWSSTAPVCQLIPLSIGDRILTNNMMLAITDIGEGASALTCHTELTTCCREQDNPSGGALGEWTGPDSNQIPESSCTDRFYVTRHQSSISLNRGGNSTVGGQYCCVIPRTGGEMTFCVNVQVATRPADTDGHTVTLAVLIPLMTMIIIVMATILIIVVKQLKDARTQLGKLSEPQTNPVYDTPGSTYEDVSKTDVGGASDHTYTPAMELSQCPAYAPTEVSTGRGGRGDVGEEGIYEN